MKVWIVVSFSVLLLAACAPAARPSDQRVVQPDEQVKKGGTLKVSMRQDPTGGFEPHQPGGRKEARRLNSLAAQYLVVMDTVNGEPCTGVIAPELAESWRFVDEKTVEVKLRQGVKFHNKPPVNGRELVADDVVWSFQRLFEWGNIKATAEDVVSIEAPDKYTVRIKTRNPMPLLLDTWFTYRGSVILAKEAGGSPPDFSQAEKLMGTGPFMFKSYTPGVNVVFERNPTYWKPNLPNVDTVELTIIREPATRMAVLRTGQLDWLDELGFSQKEQITQSAQNIRVQGCETAGSQTIYMKHTEPPFNNPTVRRAVAMSVDRAGIVKGLYRGEGKVLGFSPHFITGSLKPEDYPAQTRKYLEYNPEEAKKLLAQAGFTNGLSFQLEGTMGYGSPENEVLESLPRMMKPAGLDATLKLIDLPEFQSTRTQGKYDKIMVTNASHGIIEENLGRHRSNASGTENRGWVRDAEYDRIVDQMLQTVDEKKRMVLARQAQIRLVDEAFLVSLPSYFSFQAFQPWVKGEAKTTRAELSEQLGLMAEHVWVDK